VTPTVAETVTGGIVALTHWHSGSEAAFMFGGELEVEPGRAINLNRDLIMIDSEKTPGPEGVLVSRTVDSAEPPRRSLARS
jgi:hypothetical protein